MRHAPVLEVTAGYFAGKDHADGRVAGVGGNPMVELLDFWFWPFEELQEVALLVEKQSGDSPRFVIFVSVFEDVFDVVLAEIGVGAAEVEELEERGGHFLGLKTERNPLLSRQKLWVSVTGTLKKFFLSTSELSEYEKRYGGRLLEAVSRSFYLSLKFLPAELRGSISLAYLLARLTDTLADAEGLPPGVRLELLNELGALLQSDDEECLLAEGGGTALARRLLAEVVPQLQDEGEQRLVAELEGLFEWLTRVSEAHGKLIREMLSPIVKGQLLDIDRFSHAEASAGTVGCLPEGDALDEYTYLVAGCVGAFWTDMCAMETRGFSRSFGPGEMRERGIRLGKGLQLINVLRDFPRDLAGGRCYLPAAEIEAAGIDPADPGLRRLGKELWPLWKPWIQRCWGHLDAGLEYLEDVQPRRLLLPTGLPLMLASKTLRRLEAASWSEIEQRVKVSRGEVMQTTKELGLAAVMRGRLGKIYRGE